MGQVSMDDGGGNAAAIVIVVVVLVVLILLLLWLVGLFSPTPRPAQPDSGGLLLVFL